MIIYNVTIKIEPEIEKEWYKWMTEAHIPDVMKTGMFINSKISILFNDEKDGITYSIQYLCNCIEDYEIYQKKYAPSLQQDHNSRFKGKFTAFRTLMEVKVEF